MESKTVIKNDKPKNIEETVKVLIKQISALNNRVSSLEKENINLKTKLSIFEKYLTPQINDQIKLKEKILTDIITNINELDVINKRLLRQNKRTVYTLIYKATRDGDKAQTFHTMCDSYNHTVVLIKTLKGRRFGGYTYEKWEGEDVNKVDNRAFLFSIDKQKVYNVIRNDEAIGCYKLNGPDFCGWQIVIQDNFLTNKQCYTGEKEMNFRTDEDYELNGGEKYFGVQELEVFQVKWE
jgi:regulator of replication initiation timing